jgi:hypothetical protein
MVAKFYGHNSEGNVGGRNTYSARYFSLSFSSPFDDGGPEYVAPFLSRTLVYWPGGAGTLRENDGARDGSWTVG